MLLIHTDQRIGTGLGFAYPPTIGLTVVQAGVT